MLKFLCKVFFNR